MCLRHETACYADGGGDACLADITAHIVPIAPCLAQGSSTLCNTSLGVSAVSSPNVLLLDTRGGVWNFAHGIVERRVHSDGKLADVTPTATST